MTRIVIRELIWEEKGNLKHIRKHNVSKNEVEEAGKTLIYHRKGKRGLYLAIGRSDKRLITMVLIWRGSGKYYVVTARDSSRKERRHVYEKENK